LVICLKQWISVWFELVFQGVSNSVESSTVPVMGRKLEIIVVIDTDYILRRHITNYLINYCITNNGQLSVICIFFPFDLYELSAINLENHYERTKFILLSYLRKWLVRCLDYYEIYRITAAVMKVETEIITGIAITNYLINYCITNNGQLSVICIFFPFDLTL
jgi:hypothetical protein